MSPETAPSPGPGPGTEPAAPLPEFGTEAFKNHVAERGAAWLAARNRDAVSLLALWDLGGDEAALREAAEKFPGNPQVCLVMLDFAFRDGGDPEEQQRWTENLMAADPDNPVGWYYQARIHVEQGDAAAVMADLETALGKPGRLDYHMRERMSGLKEGLLAGGASLAEAAQLSLIAPLQNGTGGMMNSDKLMGFFKKQRAALAESGSQEAQQNLAALGLRVTEQTRQSRAPSMMTEMIGLSLKEKFLNLLDPQTEIANTGRSVAQEREILETEKQELQQHRDAFTQAIRKLMVAPAEIQMTYADLVMRDGEVAAARYLISELGKSNP